jgi:hypothetical protein
MDNWKDAKVRYGDFSISMRPFSPSVLHGWFAANRKELKKRKEIFFLSRYMVPVLISKGVFFFNLASKLLERRLSPHHSFKGLRFKQLIRYPYSSLTIDSSTPTSTPNFKKHPL